MQRFLCYVVLILLLSSAVSFVPIANDRATLATRDHRLLMDTTEATALPRFVAKKQLMKHDSAPFDFQVASVKVWTNAMASFSSFGMGLVVSAAVAAAAEDDLDVIDLPPPYVPVIVAVGILVGVGLLTVSLGDVMSDEASLGLQSGTRAKKESERSRSSYFKKKN